MPIYQIAAHPTWPYWLAWSRYYPSNEMEHIRGLGRKIWEIQVHARGIKVDDIRRKDVGRKQAKKPAMKRKKGPPRV